METVARKVHAGGAKPPHSSQSLGQKLLRVANRELVHWGLDCQAGVSKGITS